MILNGLYTILLWIDSILYSFISFLYQVFIVISKANLFTEATLRTFTDRIFTILGIVMLFYIAYEILILIVSPDKVSGENEAKNLISKLITAIIIIILLPTIFKYMQIFQNNILTSNIIGNIILGSSSETTSGGDYLKDAGTEMALSIGQSFYHPVDSAGKEYSVLDCKEESDANPKICATYISVYENAKSTNNPGSFFKDPELKDQLRIDDDKEMLYYPILSTLSAVLAMWMIVAFAIDIGIRVAKLGFLQIIAPIPIAQNITQKESLTDTAWFKSLVETYLEIFMKLIIIYFAMFAINFVPEVISNLWYKEESGASSFIQMLAMVVVILGILQFAKNAPELLKNLFNISDFGHGLSINKRLEDNTYAQRGATMLGGAGANMASRAWNTGNNFIKEKGFKNKASALGSGALETVGGLFSGAYRGYKESDGMSSWGEWRANVNRVRTKGDASVARAEARRQAAKDYNSNNQAFFTDKQGNKMYGSGWAAAARVRKNELTDNVKSQLGSAKSWLNGAVSREQYDAAVEMQRAYNQVLEPYNKESSYIDAAEADILKKYSQGHNELGVNSTQQIKNIFQSQRNEKNATTYIRNQKNIARAGKSSIKVLEKEFNKLGTKAKKEFFDNDIFKADGINIKSIKDIENLYDKLAKHTINSADPFTDTHAHALNEVSSQLGELVNSQMQIMAAKGKLNND